MKNKIKFIMLEKLFEEDSSYSTDEKRKAKAEQCVKHFLCYVKKLAPDLANKKYSDPEEMKNDISKAMIQEYVENEIIEFRKAPTYWQHHLIASDISILNKIFDCDIKRSQTELDDPFEVYCPICGGKAEYVKDSVIYGKSFGTMRYFCKKCGSHVGTYQGTSIPVGRLADAETLKYRSYVKYFLTEKMKNEDLSRTEAIDWLSQKMDIYDAHIGEFNLKDCKKALALIDS